MYRASSDVGHIPKLRIKLFFKTMKTQCLLRGNKYHTTAWVEAETTKLSLRVEIDELGGVWEIVEIYPYRLTDKQLKTHDALMAH